MASTVEYQVEIALVDIDAGVFRDSEVGMPRRFAVVVIEDRERDVSITAVNDGVGPHHRSDINCNGATCADLLTGNNLPAHM